MTRNIIIAILICFEYDRWSSFVKYKSFNRWCSMVPDAVLLIANSIFTSNKERDYSTYTFKAFVSLLSHRQWIKARTMIIWHFIFPLCLVLLSIFRLYYHHLIQHWIDHSDYHPMILYLLVSFDFVNKIDR